MMRVLRSSLALFVLLCLGMSDSVLGQTTKQSRLISSPKPPTPKKGGLREAEATVPASLGTVVHWVPDSKTATERARKEGKLLFVIHVSGNFEKEEFT